MKKLCVFLAYLINCLYLCNVNKKTRVFTLKFKDYETDYNSTERDISNRVNRKNSKIYPIPCEK